MHPGTGEIATGTEFFIEFIQNKPTITRDYAKLHGLYLVGYGPTKFLVSRGQLHSTASFKNDPVELHKYASILKLGMFPKLFEGNLSSYEAIMQGVVDEGLRRLVSTEMSGIDFSDPLQIVNGMISTFSKVQSSLGGQAEGVVITVGGDDMTPEKLYKVLASDQHSKEARHLKKSRYLGTDDEENSYWKEVNRVVDDVLDRVGTGDPEQTLKKVSKIVYSMDVPSHPVKKPINVQEDIVLTAKLRLYGTGTHGAFKVAVIPMAAKPFHAGHDNLIEQAIADGNDAVILFISTGGREELSSSDMTPVWRDFYAPGIQRTYGDKVVLRFTDQPLRDSTNVAIDQAKKGLKVSLYGDEVDATERVNKILSKMPALSGSLIAKPVPRGMTGGVSGTAMRGYLTNNDDASFKENLPGWLTPRERDAIWSSLSKTSSAGLRSENVLRSWVRSRQRR